MTDTNQKLSHLISGQIPDYVQDYYPMFVIFMSKYFEFLENSSNSAQYALQNIRLNRDIDTTADELAVQFLNTYVPGLPNDAALNRSILVKHFRDFYQRKGSEQSFKFFFKAFFNDDIEIVYPRTQMFATSAGDYYKETGIRVRSNIGNPENLKHTKIFGSSSGAYAVVNRVVQVVGAGGNNVYDLVFQPLSWVGLLTSGEAVTGTYYNYDNNTSGFVSTTSISGINILPGVYLDSQSQLSNNQVLQDSLYYQQFSYVIRSKQDRETWAKYVLDELHPTGTIMYNEWHNDQIPAANTTGFVRTNRVETTVNIPMVKQYFTQPTFSFDRTGDVYTGTSFTQLATTTGFAAVAYTGIGDITYDVNFDYPGENITWALQKAGDTSSVTEVVRFDGATFDKLLRSVTQDSQIISWSRDTNSSIVNTRYIAVSSLLTAGTVLTAFSTTLQLDTTSMLLLITWMKNTTGNNAKGESSNAVVITFSSNATIIPYFDNEEQRKNQRIAVGSTLDYNKLFLVTSSNSITNNAVVTSGVPLTSTVTTSRIVFKPFNWERGATYDRVAIRFAIDRQLQLNTSITETFNSVNITASGLIASWSSITTSVSTISFNAASSTGVYAFSSNCFVFNGIAGQSRFIQTTSLMSSEQVDVSLSYCVGDAFNGGEAPDSGEDLEIQYSLNSGTTWITGSKLWIGGNSWPLGNVQKFGRVYVSSGSTQVQGSDTLFLTDYVVGDRITIGSSTTTAYTITGITNNNLMTITPTVLYNSSGTILEGNAFSYAIGSGTANSNFDGTWNFNMNSGATTVLRASGLRALSGNTVNIEARIRLNSNSNPGSLFGVDYGDGPAGTALTLPVGQFITTSFTLIGGPLGHLDFPGDGPNGFNFDLDYVRINGQIAFFKPPVNQQFQTTSVTVYGPNAASVSAIVRVIQLNATGAGQDTYAIDNLTVSAFRRQATTGTVNIGVAVSSNSTLNINDTDFFNITTIGA